MLVSGRCKSLQNPTSITEEISLCSAQTRKPAISWRSWKKWRLSPDVPCGERLLQRSNDRRKPPAGKQWFIDVSKTKRPHGLKDVRIRIAFWNFDGFSTGLVFCLKLCFSDGAESFPSWQSWGATIYSWSYVIILCYMWYHEIKLHCIMWLYFEYFMLYCLQALLRRIFFLLTQNLPDTPHLGGIFEIFCGHQDTQVQKIEEFLRLFFWWWQARNLVNWATKTSETLHYTGRLL